MNETAFNADLRAVMRTQGLGVLHIREADQPGTADLLIWQDWQSSSSWVELKVGDHQVEPHQWQFLEERAKEGFPCFVVTLKGGKGEPAGVHVGRVAGRGHRCYYVGYKPDFHKVDWAKLLIAEQS